MQDEPLRIERRQRVAIVTLCRPERRNALSRELLLSLGALGRELVADPELDAVVLTGEGDRAFCAGADLKERQGMNPAQIREQLLLYRTELQWLDTCPCPVVAAINGAALGGGLELALLCDLRVAAMHATLALPETSLGVIPGAGGTQHLPRLIGEARAKELILLGRRLTATEALSFGLVNRVTPSGGSVVEDTLAWMKPIINGAPVAQRAALAAIDAARIPTWRAGLQAELDAYAVCLESEDRLEALAAFREKRAPRFRRR